MKRELFILLFCFSFFASSAQNLFVADYAAGGGDNYFSLITYDRCFFSAFEEQNGIVTVMKTDSAGNVLWSNRMDFLSTGYFHFAAIEQAADSGFLLLLNITRPSMPNSDPTVARLDKFGNYLWTQNYTSVLSTFAYSIIKNNDNGFIITGSRQIHDFVLKCDSAGSVIWAANYMSASNVGNHDIATHDYDRFVIAGRQGTDVMFFTFHVSGGSVGWNSAISIANAPIGRLSIIPSHTGGYVVAGQLNYIAGNYFDSFLLKVDSMMAVQWVRVYSASGETSVYDVVELADSSLLLVGYNEGINGNGFILKTDADGNLLFSKTELLPFSEYGSVHSFNPGTVMIGGRRGSALSFVALTDTGCSSLCNITALPIQEFQPAYVNSVLVWGPQLVTFTQGIATSQWTTYPLVRNVLCGPTSAIEITSKNETTLYPNPASTDFTLETDDASTPFDVEVYDAYGRLVFAEINRSSGYKVNTHGWANGLYSVVVHNENKSTTLKLLTQEME